MGVPKLPIVAEKLALLYVAISAHEEADFDKFCELVGRSFGVTAKAVEDAHAILVEHGLIEEAK